MFIRKIIVREGLEADFAPLAKATVDADKHILPAFRGDPEDHELVHGLDLDAPSEVRGLDGGIYGKKILTSPAGRKVLLKPDDEDFKYELGVEGRSLPLQEALFRRLSVDGFRRREVPRTTVFENPKDKTLWSAQEIVEDGRHTFEADSYGGVVATPKSPESVRIRNTKLSLMDFLLGNVDRHEGNWMETPNKGIALIDNGLSFGRSLPEPGDYKPSYIDHDLYTAPPHPVALAWAKELVDHDRIQQFVDGAVPDSLGRKDVIRGLRERLARLKGRRKGESLYDLFTKSAAPLSGSGRPTEN